MPSYLKVQFNFHGNEIQTNTQTMPYSNKIINYACRSGMGVWQSEIFYTENTIKSQHVNGDVTNRQAAFKWKILKLSPHSSVVRGAWNGWNCLTPSTMFVCIFKQIFFLNYSTYEDGPIAVPSTSVRKYHSSFRNVSEEGRFQLTITSFGIIFGLSQLNIAHHLNYAINLPNI